MQATSGAGRSPGVIAQDIVDNVVPFIRNEEQKVEKETKKILGALDGDQIVPADIQVSATCTRVPVLDGHTEAVTVALDKPASLDEVKAALRSFGKDMNPGTHPSAPKDWIWVHDDPFRPQPRLDLPIETGLVTLDPILQDFRFTEVDARFRANLNSGMSRSDAMTNTPPMIPDGVATAGGKDGARRSEVLDMIGCAGERAGLGDGMTHELQGMYKDATNAKSGNFFNWVLGR